MRNKFVTLKNGSEEQRRKVAYMLVNLLEDQSESTIHVFQFDEKHAGAGRLAVESLLHREGTVFSAVSRSLLLTGALHEDYLHDVEPKLEHGDWVIATHWLKDIFIETGHEVAYDHIYHDFQVDCSRPLFDVREAFLEELHTHLANA